MSSAFAPPHASPTTICAPFAALGPSLPSDPMLLYVRTSLLTSKAQTLVNTVNCVGIMGKGIAAEFRKRYPEMFEEYREICARGELKPGGIWLWHGPDHNVLNFATKDHWRNPSKLEWIVRGLRTFQNEYAHLGITEISFPRLGCGNGGLDWEEVRPIMEQHLADLPIQVFIHDFEANIGLPEHSQGRRSKKRDPQRGGIGSFETFLSALRDTVDARAGRFAGVSSNRPVIVSFDERTDSMLFESEGNNSRVERTDLRSVWVAALTGLVTRANLVAAKSLDADFLLGLLGTLPNARLIEIQRWDSPMPEIAVELRGQLSQAEAPSFAGRSEEDEGGWDSEHPQ